MSVTVAVAGPGPAGLVIGRKLPAWELQSESVK
jgi:hypothetical protein